MTEQVTRVVAMRRNSSLDVEESRSSVLQKREERWCCNIHPLTEERASFTQLHKNPVHGPIGVT